MKPPGPAGLWRILRYYSLPVQSEACGYPCFFRGRESPLRGLSRALASRPGREQSTAYSMPDFLGTPHRRPNQLRGTRYLRTPAIPTCFPVSWTPRTRAVFRHWRYGQGMEVVACASLVLPLYTRANPSRPSVAPPSPCLVLTALVWPLFIGESHFPTNQTRRHPAVRHPGHPYRQYPPHFPCRPPRPDCRLT